MPEEYKYHELCESLPMMSDEDLKDLAEDIKLNGLRFPINRWKGLIIDGRNRLAACQLAGVKPIIKDREDVLKDELDVARFIISANLIVDILYAFLDPRVRY